MSDSNNYSFQVNQTSPFTFNIVAETPDHLKFSTNLQCNPNQLTVENLIRNLTQKETRYNWILDINAEATRITKDEVPENKDVIDIQEVKEILPDVQKEEIKLIPAETGIAPEKTLDAVPKIEDTLVYES